MTNSSDRPCQVLLIDDEAALLNALALALESDGIAVEKAASAAQAIRILDTTPTIELIVSDIQMPGMDGIKILQHVRERFEQRSWLQIIFMTAYATLENSVEAIRLAASDFLYKPIRRDVLIQSVRRALEKAASAKRDSQFRENGAGHLERLSSEMLALRGLLNASEPKDALNDAENQESGKEKQPLSKERLLSLVQSNAVKKKLFRDELFNDPVWNMLLDLMQHHLVGKEVAASSLYFSSGAPLSTASRRLSELEQAGFVTRKIDEADRRRQIVTITPKTYRMIESYFRTIDEI